MPERRTIIISNYHSAVRNLSLTGYFPEELIKNVWWQKDTEKPNRVTTVQIMWNVQNSNINETVALNSV